MHVSRTFAVVLMALAIASVPVPAFAIPLVPDNFEDGTTQGWLANLLGMGAPFPSPINVADGGPLGPGDNYLLLTSIGGTGNGSRLTAMNPSQWAGDYLAAGVTEITMSANNLGTTELFLRLAFEDPMGGPPSNIAFSSDPIAVPAGSGWTTIAFPVLPAFLTAGVGDVEDALQNTTLLRLYHSEADNFPNPVFPIPAVVAQLGVDNIGVTAIPEPATIWLVTGGIGALVARRRRRQRVSVKPPNAH